MKIINHSEHERAAQPSFVYRMFDDIPLYDQRCMPRLEMNNTAYYRIRDGRIIFKTKIKDLSLSGACLIVSPDVQPAQKLALKIYLSNKESFETESVVIWKRSLSDHCCYAGVIFEHLCQSVQDLILEHAFDFSASKEL